MSTGAMLPDDYQIPSEWSKDAPRVWPDLIAEAMGYVDPMIPILLPDGTTQPLFYWLVSTQRMHKPYMVSLKREHVEALEYAMTKPPQVVTATAEMHGALARDPFAVAKFPVLATFGLTYPDVDFETERKARGVYHVSDFAIRWVRGVRGIKVNPRAWVFGSNVYADDPNTDRLTYEEFIATHPVEDKVPPYSGPGSTKPSMSIDARLKHKRLVQQPIEDIDEEEDE